MPDFDAVKFAEWMMEAYEKSSFKSYARLGEKVGVSRATISNLIGAKEQYLTGKPSRPKRDLVIKIAAALNADVNKALRLAGHASSETSLSEVDDEFAALFYESADWSEENRNEALEMAKIIFKRFKEKERAQKETQK